MLVTAKAIERQPSELMLRYAGAFCVPGEPVPECEVIHLEGLHDNLHPFRFRFLLWTLLNLGH